MTSASRVETSLRPDASVMTVLGLAVAAWIALAALGNSPLHGEISHAAFAGPTPQPWIITTLAIGWILMVAAMMLPTVLPLVSLFGQITEQREDRRRLLAALLAAYLLVWFGAGVAMKVGATGIQLASGEWGWLGQNRWAITAGALALAGTYQLSDAKSRCLRRCRTPQSFLRRHWRGGRPASQALRIGLDHGAYCVGCCWLLMVVMFSVGTGNALWMGALNVVMVVEKTARFGKRITVPVGAGLLIAALATAVAS